VRRGIAADDAPHLPPEVETRWSAAWGDEVVEAARREIARRPPLDLTFKSDEDAQAFAAATGGAALASRHVRVHSSQGITDLPGFDAGDWWVQDLAASFPARLIPAQPKSVLDLCSAPGGKAMQLAAAGHRVTAVDSSAQRLERLSENLQRTNLPAQLICADVLEWEPKQPFDAILLDAPCSATGTFRRHPEVLYRARPRIIAESAELQAKLLDQAAVWVKEGDVLVYAVCSLEPREGEEIITAFLRDQPQFRIAPPEPGELPAFAVPAAKGWVRILPGLLENEGGLDGFFAVRLVRTA
jgi:16S rRNA (cytosine967-C5)-methyltransferase